MRQEKPTSTKQSSNHKIVIKEIPGGLKGDLNTIFVVFSIFQNTNTVKQKYVDLHVEQKSATIQHNPTKKQPAKGNKNNNTNNVSSSGTLTHATKHHVPTKSFTQENLL